MTLESTVGHDSEPLTATLPGRLMIQEMGEQPTVVARLIDRNTLDAAGIRERISKFADGHVNGVVIIARGSSLNAATYLAYLIEVVAGIPVSLARPSVFTQYNARPKYNGWLAVAFSQSGETPEIVAAGLAIREAGAILLAVTNNSASALAGASDLHLDVSAGPELAVPATKTVIGQMICALTIAFALAGKQRPDDIDALPRSIEGLLRSPEAANRLALRWAGSKELCVVARGFGFGAGLEIALKIRETAAMFAEAWSVTAFLHGPIAGLRSDIQFLNLSLHSNDDPDSETATAQLRALGVDVARCAPDPLADLPLPQEPEYLLPLYAVVRGQQLAYALALNAGLDPDAPHGLNKVTMTA
jgi:glutamine---fructose-6-phosphate transaminase (isomerizing)